MSKKEDEYVDYEDSPLKLLWDIRGEILPSYLWKLWAVMMILIVVGMCIGIVDLSSVDASNLIDSGVSGMTFTLVIISAALEVFRENELIKLIEIEDKRKNKKGLYFLELLIPYVFTAVIFLIISLISIVSPYVFIQLPDLLVLFINVMYIGIVLAGFISLFNICYSIVNHFYYAMRRRVSNLKGDDE